MTDFKFITILLVQFLLYMIILISGDDPLVNLKLGQVRGSTMKTLTGLPFAAFRGIPYAMPPVGDLRFRAPVPLTEPWNYNHFDARKEGPECIQYNKLNLKVVGQEDCLFLNVYTPRVPKTSNDEKYPVMIFIHGGGSNYGSGASFMYGPRRLLDYNVVLVTFNYRLHSLGFLSTHDEYAPGNYGLLDQVEVFKWVQANIDAFGGDVNNVTIFGHSAGGSHVILHLMSPKTSGLFHKAIAMSGSPLGYWAFIDEPKTFTNKLAESVNCSRFKSNSRRMVECLRQVPSHNLTEFSGDSLVKGLKAFGPVFDGEFLLDDPINLFRRKKIINKVPLMIGVTKDEGLFFVQDASDLKYSEKLVAKIASMVLNVHDANKLGKSVEFIQKEYFSHVDVTNVIEVRKTMAQVLTDSKFMAPHYETLPYLVNAGFTPFVYSLDYVTNHSITKLMREKTLQGVAHGDDLYFLFDSSFNFPDDHDKLLDVNEKKFLKLWINFVNHGNPTPNTEDSNSLTTWPQTSDEEILVYHLDKEIKIEKYHVRNNPKINLWTKVIPSALYAAEFSRDEL